ncbi:MAG TPA: hypothetical protein VFY04_11805 [Solirubrobacterales bacterium]|nr:hypothetical protein [Solirubrobacterales bacterium]
MAPLVSQALAGELTVDSIGVEGLTAFAFLPLRSNVDEAVGILGRTLAAARRPDVADEQIRTVAGAMVRLGERVLEEQSAPDWLVEAAYESGLSLRQVVAMWARVRELDQDQFPESISGWAAVLVDILQDMPYSIVGEMLSLDALNGSLMRALADETATPRHPAAWNVFGEMVQGWLAGMPLTDLAALSVKENALGKSGRGSGNPLPKIIGLTEQIMVFSLTRIAGGLSVLIASAAERETDLAWELSPRSTYALDQLSMGIRAGCGTPESLAWWRFGGVRHRRLEPDRV